jgi:hypothetical protein
MLSLCDLYAEIGAWDEIVELGRRIVRVGGATPD